MQRTDTKWLALWTWNENIPLPQSSKDPGLCAAQAGRGPVQYMELLP